MITINLTPFPVLTTERLVLRQFENSDENDLYLLRSDERVNEFLDRSKPESMEDIRKFIQKINTGIINNEAIMWAVTLKDDLKLIGTVCLWNISKDKCSGEIGYDLLPDFQGKGIMQEALEKTIEFGFKNMNLQTIDAVTRLLNHKSIRLLEKNNFERNSTLQNELTERVEFSNAVIYTLSKNTI